MTTVSVRSVADRSSSKYPTACFSVHADTDPGLMPRILEIFAKRGLVPTRWYSRVDGPDNGLTIDLEMAGLTPEMSAGIAAEMRAVWGVGLVLSSEKHAG